MQLPLPGSQVPGVWQASPAGQYNTSPLHLAVLQVPEQGPYVQLGYGSAS